MTTAPSSGEAIRMLERVLAYVSPDSVGVSQYDACLLDVGIAEEAIDAWLTSEGHPPRQSPEAPLPLTRLAVRLAAATTDHEIDALTAAVAVQQRKAADAMVVRTCFISQERFQRILKEDALDRLSDLLQNPRLSREQAGTILGQLLEGSQREGSSHHSKALGILLERFPDVAHDATRQMLEVAHATLGRAAEINHLIGGSGCNSGSLPVLLTYLLRQDLLPFDDMATAAGVMGGEFHSELLSHPRATPDVWRTEARTRFGKGSKVRQLLKIPGAMRDSDTCALLLERSDNCGYSSRDEFLVRMLKSIPPEGLPQMLPHLFAETAHDAFDKVSTLPAVFRQQITQAMLTEIAATHPDSLARQRAILFVVPVDADAVEKPKAPRRRQAP